MTNNLFVSVCSFSVDEDEEASKYSSPSFYVADDEKSIAIIDILEYIGSKEMTFKFYLNLLQDLTDMLDIVELAIFGEISSRTIPCMPYVFTTYRIMFNQT